MTRRDEAPAEQGLDLLNVRAPTRPEAEVRSVYAVPQAQSSGRLQADTPLGRLILQDMPERNLMLEAYRK